MIILSLFISMTTYDMANERISEDIANNKVDETSDNTNANNYAKNIMKTYEQEQEYQPHSQPSQHSQMPPQMPQNELAQQYQPPVPPQQQPPVPQQSQHQRPQQSAASASGSYTGFDSSDNLAPLDADFTPMKEPVRRPVNIHSESRMSDNVEPYSDANMELFSSF